MTAEEVEELKRAREGLARPARGARAGDSRQRAAVGRERRGARQGAGRHRGHRPRARRCWAALSLSLARRSRIGVEQTQPWVAGLTMPAPPAAAAVPVPPVPRDTPYS